MRTDALEILDFATEIAAAALIWNEGNFISYNENYVQTIPGVNMTVPFCGQKTADRGHFVFNVSFRLYCSYQKKK